MTCLSGIFKFSSMTMVLISLSLTASAQSQTIVQAPTVSQITAQDNAVKQAQQARNSANQGMNMANIASMAGAAAIGYGFSTCPEACNIPYIVAGAATIMLSSQAGQSNANMGFQADQLLGRITNPGTNPPPSSPTKYTLPPTAVKALKDAKITIDPTTGVATGPNGLSITPAQAAAGNFSGTGLSASDQALAKAKLADILNKAKEQASAEASKNGEGIADVDSSGGGGKGLSKFDPNAFAMPKMPNFGLGKNARKPTSAFGMTKKLANGESIGVAGDDIFAMMTRRYEAIGSSERFLGDPVGSPAPVSNPLGHGN